METFELIYNYEEALKRLHKEASDVGELRRAVEMEGDVPKSITDKQLLLFLEACGSVDEAVKVIKIYYDVKENTPQLFRNRDPQSPAIQQCFKNQFNLFLPVTPNDGNSVVFIGLENDKSSNYDFDNANKTFFMTLDACLSAHGPQSGLIMLFDMKHVGFGHMTKIKLNTQKAFIDYAQDALPAKLKSIHVFNVSALFQMVLAILRPMMNTEVIGKIHLHSSSMDFEEFYQTTIPKQCMTSDYGGDLASVQELNRQNSEELVKLKKYFAAEQDQVFNKQQD
ncbi:unnamed protein product [Diamesa serratosioi]